MLDMNTLNAAQIRDLQAALTPRLNKYIPVIPTAKQTAALLMNTERELLYGGAARRGQKCLFINGSTAVC